MKSKIGCRHRAERHSHRVDREVYILMGDHTNDQLVDLLGFNKTQDHRASDNKIFRGDVFGIGRTGGEEESESGEGGVATLLERSLRSDHILRFGERDLHRRLRDTECFEHGVGSEVFTGPRRMWDGGRSGRG